MACGEPIALDEAVAFDVFAGFSGSEDFVFSPDGDLISVDANGNLTKQALEGDPRVFVPNLGETAGTRMLPNGDVVIAVVSEGQLLRIAPNGARDVLASGLAYPNGVEVDAQGYVFVAEHDAGRVLQIHVDTKEQHVVADGLFHPNGLSLSPDENTLYIGTFGGGTVHSVERGGNGVFDSQALFAAVTSTQLCDGLAEGDSCGGGFDNGEGEGVCTTLHDDVVCVMNGTTPPSPEPGVEPGPLPEPEPDAGPGAEPEPDLPTATSCDAVGDDCSVTWPGQGGFDNTCVAEADGDVVCPFVPSTWVTACDGSTDGAACQASDPFTGVFVGTCYTSWPEYDGGDFLVCYPDGSPAGCDGLNAGDVCVTDFGDQGVCRNTDEGLVCGGGFVDDDQACAGKAEGDACTGTDSGVDGECASGAPYGVDHLVCAPPLQGGGGGLDGVAVDNCGYVYVTEYIQGKIWRVSPDGRDVELFLKLPSSWIPNLHWGLGVGGFEKDTLYIMDRDEGRLFAVQPGVEERPQPHAVLVEDGR